MTKTKQVTVVFIFAIACLIAPFAGTVQADAQAPRVIAYTIGVTSYADDSKLLGCDDNARLIADRIRQSFPGADVTELISGADDPPTADRVRRLLHLDVPEIPKHSVLILYFAGHGIRVGDPQRVGRTELGIVLEGGSPRSEDPDLANLVLYSEIVSALSRTRMANFMVYLDCCFSGPPELPTADFTQLEFKLLGIRGFILGAAQRDQKTLGNLFSEALDRYWTGDMTICRRPPDVVEAIREIVQALVRERFADASRNWVNPTLLLGGASQTCTTVFGKPSTLLFIYPPHRQNMAHFTFGDSNREETFQASTESFHGDPGFYVRQIAKEPISIICRTSRDPDRRVELTHSQLEGDILVVDFRRPNGQELDVPRTIADLRAVSDTAYAAGARDATAFTLELALAQTIADLDPDAPADNLLARWRSRDYDDARWRLFHADPSREDLVAVGSDPDALRVASLLSWTGSPNTAVALLKEGIPYLTASAVREKFDAHQFVAYSLNGDHAAAASISSAYATSVDISPDGRLIRTLADLNQSELRAASLSLPTVLPPNTNNRPAQ